MSVDSINLGNLVPVLDVRHLNAKCYAESKTVVWLGRPADYTYFRKTWDVHVGTYMTAHLYKKRPVKKPYFTDCSFNPLRLAARNLSIEISSPLALLCLFLYLVIIFTCNKV